MRNISSRQGLDTIAAPTEYRPATALDIAAMDVNGQEFLMLVSEQAVISVSVLV